MAISAVGSRFCCFYLQAWWYMHSCEEEETTCSNCVLTDYLVMNLYKRSTWKSVLASNALTMPAGPRYPMINMEDIILQDSYLHVQY